MGGSDQSRLKVPVGSGSVNWLGCCSRLTGVPSGSAFAAGCSLFSSAAAGAADVDGGVWVGSSATSESPHATAASVSSVSKDTRTINILFMASPTL